MYRKILLSVLLCLSYCTMRGQVDVFTAEKLVQTLETYEHFDNLKFPSSVVYLGGVARTKEGYMKFRPESKGHIGGGIATEVSERLLKSVQINWDTHGNPYSVKVYGRDTPYNLDKDFIYKNARSWGDLLVEIKKGDNKVYDFSKLKERYRYVGIRAEKGAVYMNSVNIEWEKYDRKLSFAQTDYYAAEGVAFNPPTLSGVVEGGVTYVSSNTDVAQVDAYTGEVRIVGRGIATISASVEENDSYQADKAEYLLHVVNSVNFDFSDRQAICPGVELEQSLPDVFSVVSEDIEVIVKKGTETTKFIDDNGYIILRLAAGATLEVRAPDGLCFENVNLGFYTLVGGTGSIKLIQEGNPRIYQVEKEKVAGISAITALYSGDYRLNVSEVGHSTFSSGRAYVLPEGLKGGVVTVDEESKVATVDYCVCPGDIVAAKQALLIKGAPGVYTLPLTDGAGLTFDGIQNSLCPILTSLPVKAPEDSQFYIFSLNKENRLGFYWQTGSHEGDQVKGIANKAYLKMPKSSSSSAQGYRLNWDGATGVEKLDEYQVKSDAVVYTLAGVRVFVPKEELSRGVYLVNGMKVYIK